MARVLGMISGDNPLFRKMNKLHVFINLMHHCKYGTLL